MRLDSLYIVPTRKVQPLLFWFAGGDPDPPEGGEPGVGGGAPWGVWSPGLVRVYGVNFFGVG